MVGRKAGWCLKQWRVADRSAVENHVVGCRVSAKGAVDGYYYVGAIFAVGGWDGGT